MGTRHTIAVVVDGQERVLQYGQWDGYPSGQGLDVLAFAREMNRAGFTERVRRCREITPAELEEIGRAHLDDWKDRYPWLSRDAGADILRHVASADDGLALKIDRAGVRHCEWGYVVDLDAGTLEVHTVHDDRLPSQPGRLSEHGDRMRLVATYPLGELPTDAEFLERLDPPDAAEGA